MPDLTALRTAALAQITWPDPGPIRWRVVQIEYMGGVAPVCTATEYTYDSTTVPTHQLDAEVFGPDARDDTGLYDCCPEPWIECRSDALAAYLVALLNRDAEAANNREQLGVGLARAEAAASVSPICEIPHGSIEEEDACEQQRLHDRATAPTAAFAHGAAAADAGTVDGIRPHRPVTPEQDAQMKRAAEQLEKDDPMTPERAVGMLYGQSSAAPTTKES